MTIPTEKNLPASKKCLVSSVIVNNKYADVARERVLYYTCTSYLLIHSIAILIIIIIADLPPDAAVHCSKRFNICCFYV